MKKEKKFKLEKFEVAKLDNLKKIKGGVFNPTDIVIPLPTLTVSVNASIIQLNVNNLF